MSAASSSFDPEPDPAVERPAGLPAFGSSPARDPKDLGPGDGIADHRRLDRSPRGRNRFRAQMLWLLAVLVAMLIVPPFLEKVSYSWNLGETKAAREGLKELGLDKFSQASRVVAKTVGQSVVYINTVRDVVDDQVADERLFYGGPQIPRELVGQGSGVIIDKDGYILTNFHVVAGATQIEVHLSGRRPRPAEIVGVDADTDLAVVKIDGDGLTPIGWGDSSQLQVGDFVWAVGSPFGLDNSVTFGIISAKGRRGVGSGRYQDFLQTDAAINPGNSGGALVNIRGELIGINTAIVGPTNAGIGFAIPSDLARDVYQRLKKEGQYARGYLGVRMRELTPDRAIEMGLKENQSGAIVDRVLDGTPAAAGGLQAGDLLLRWNDKEIGDPTRLSLLVAATEPDTSANLVVMRQGQEKTLTIKVGKLPPKSPR